MPSLSDRSIDSEDENDPDSAYDSQGNSTSIDISCNKYDSTPQLNDRSTVTIDDSDPESDCNSESDTINNTDEATHTSTPYDPSTSYISRQCHLQQHRRQKQPILQIHGDALGVKEDDSVRILFESFNGLAAWKPRNDKILLARRLLHRLKVDCYTGTECNVQWNLLKDVKQLRQLFKTEVETSAISACNKHESDDRLQHGGTGIIMFDRMASIFNKYGTDPTGLGRWCWRMTRDKTNTAIRIITAYQPCRSSKRRLNTVYIQQRRYFRSNGDNRCPRAIFRLHLKTLLKTWTDAGDNVILFIDANENLATGPITKLLRAIHMHDVIGIRTGLPGPATHAAGKNQIDGVFATPNINITGARFLPLWTGIGDHRAILIDIAQDSLYGETLPKIVKPSCRRLQCYNTKVRNKYNERDEKLMRINKLPQKYQQLIDMHHRKDISAFETLHEQLDKTKKECMIASEKKCRKIHAGSVDYSDEVFKWRDRRELWNLIIRHHKGMRINTTIIRRKAYSLGIPSPLNCTLREAERAHKICTATYNKLKPRAPAHRKIFLNRLKNDAIKNNDDARLKTIKQTIQQEELKRTWTKINNAKKRTTGGSISKVSVTVDGVITTHTTEATVVPVVMQFCNKKFMLTHDTPLMDGSDISNDIGFDGSSPACAQIRAGTYTFPASTDTHTKTLLTLIGTVTRRLNFKLVRHSITVDDFIEYWKGSREKTSSSYSGLHFGHWKAASWNKFTASIHAKSIELAFRAGLPLKRWKVGLSVMLEKIPGNTSVEKLRAILLMEADFNFGNKLLFGQRMVKAAEKAKVLPDDSFGSRKNKSSQEFFICRLLFFDIVRLSKHNAALGSYDAQTCYDRVVHSLTSLVGESVGMPLPNLTCLFLAIQGMRFYLRTAFGDSSSFYSCESDTPYQGLVQGNGAAPAFWLLVSSYILLYLKSQGHCIKVKSAISNVAMIYTALMYVDDGDFPTFAEEGNESMISVATTHQQTVDCWTGGLRTSGGALKPAKCFWHPIKWEWKNGKARVVPAAKIKSDIKVTGPDSITTNISKLDYNTAREVMGIWQAPSGQMHSQLEKMANINKDYIEMLQNNYLHRKIVWTSFWGSHWPSLKYCLSGLSISKEEGDTLMIPLYKTLMPKLGVVGNAPLAYRYGSEKYFGFGLPNIHIDHIIAKLNIYIVHFTTSTLLQNHSPTLLGQHIQQTSERLQLEVGIDTPFFHLPYSVYGIYTTSCWLSHLWEQIENLPIQIECRKQPLMGIQRVGDEYIMATVKYLDKYNTDQLLSINNVRLALRCYTIADLFDGAGTSIRRFVFQHRRRHIHSPYIWPRSKPCKKDYLLWEEAIKAVIQYKQLGDWFHKQHSPLLCKYDTVNDFVYVPNATRGWDVYILDGKPRNRQYPIYNLSHTSNTPPSPFQRGTLTHMKNNKIQFEGAANVLPNTYTPPTTIIDILISWGEIWIWDQLQIAEEGKWLADAIETNTATLVCDGSYQPHLTTERGSAAWTIECSRTKKRAIGVTATTTKVANAYRSELTGIYAALAIVRAVTILHNVTSGRLDAGCDNEQAVFLSSVLDTKVPTSKSHSDILRCIRLVRSQLDLDITFSHIKGHQDDALIYTDLNRNSQLNVDCDLLAKAGLRRLHHRHQPQPTALPHESILIWINSEKVIGDVGPPLRNEISRIQMRTFLAKKKILNYVTFDEVDWLAVEKFMAKEPQQYKLWITKHISGFCATSKMMFHRNKSATPDCPVCKQPGVRDETRHQAVCPDPQRQEIWKDSVSTIDRWLHKVDTHPILHFSIIKYLLKKDTTTLTTILDGSLPELGISQDNIGWHNFTEGKLSLHFNNIQHIHYTSTDSKRNSISWVSGLIKRLLLIIHDQWVYRNDIVHKRDKDGLKRSEASALRVNIRAQLSFGNQNLDPEDHFLVEYDYDLITSWPATKRKEWLTAIRAARNIRTTRTAHQTRTRKRNRQQQDNPPPSTTLTSTASPTTFTTTPPHSPNQTPDTSPSPSPSPSPPPPARPPPRRRTRSKRKRRGTSRTSHPEKRSRRPTTIDNSPLLEATHRQGMVGRGKRKRTHQFSSWKTSRKKL